MRKAYPTQLRFDTVLIQNVALNLECRDSIVPVSRALQHVYANRQLTTSILDLIAASPLAWHAVFRSRKPLLSSD